MSGNRLIPPPIYDVASQPARKRPRVTVEDDSEGNATTATPHPLPLPSPIQSTPQAASSRSTHLDDANLAAHAGPSTMQWHASQRSPQLGGHHRSDSGHPGSEPVLDTQSTPSGVPQADIPDEDMQQLPLVTVLKATVELEGSTSFEDLPLPLLDVGSLLTILAAHSVSRSSGAQRVRRRPELVSLAASHRCSSACARTRFVLSHDFEDGKFAEDSVVDVRKRLERMLKKRVLDKFPRRLTSDRKDEIVKAWLDKFSNTSMEMVTCAVCSERLLRSQTENRTLSDAQLNRLCNEKVREKFEPPSSVKNVFKGAILNLAGWEPTEDAPTNVITCTSCGWYLDRTSLPPLALANDNYLGHAHLPARIKELFEKATAVELSLIARYRVRCTIHKFSAKPGESPAFSQRYMKGNTITFTNECDSLLNVLPPTREVVGDTICVMFVGSVYPSPEELQRFTPILARRHVVYELLTWLKANNPFYKDIQISMENLAALLPTEEPTVPVGISLRHIKSTVKEAEASTYVPEEAVDENTAKKPVDVASHGVIAGSIEGMSVSEIKLTAIKHWKSGGGAYTIPHSKVPISEYDNPALFPCMFPHLFPYGIGGLEDKNRRTHLNIEAHVKHLLNLSNTSFQTDPSFGFVAMNILQRRKTSRASRFKLSRKTYKRTAELLSSVEASTCQRLIKRSQEAGGYVAAEDDDEREVLELLEKVDLLAGNVPGSSASKRRMRNSIRAQMHWSGMPTFFVTINPADVYSPLFCKIAGIGNVDLSVKEPDLPGEFERRQYLARNPAAAARFFSAIMQAFFDVIVGMKHRDGGLFGNVEAYYGTIEAQGRGSLHCHMLIWVTGGLPPEKLREEMASSEERKQEILSYIEEMIQTGRPDDKGVAPPEEFEFVKRPKGDPHPCKLRCPHPDDEDFEKVWREQLQRLVLDCNYHIHSETCWKYLKAGEARDDAHCRMRIDGSTRDMTTIDPETGSILLRRFHPFINNWNEIIIMLVRCNMDIKFIGSGKGAKALIYYVTDYITKASLPTHVAFSALQHVIEILQGEPVLARDNETEEEAIERRGRILLVKACNALVGNQELSGQQVMMNLLGLAKGDGDHFTSHTYRIVHWTSILGWIRRQEGVRIDDERDQPDYQGDTVLEGVGSESDVDDVLSSGGSSVGEENEDRRVDVDEMIDTSSEAGSDDEVILDLGPKECDDALSPQSQLTDYRLRPHAMAEIPVYWYFAGMQKETKANDAKRKLGREVDEVGENIMPLRRGQEAASREDFLDGHPQAHSHVMRNRRFATVPVLLGPSIVARGDGTVSEDYARTALVLFKPWRVLDDLLPVGETWVEQYTKYKFDARSTEVLDNMNCLHECKDARDEYNRLRREGALKEDLINDELIIEASEDSAKNDEEFMHVVADLAPQLLPEEMTGPNIMQAYEDTRKAAEARAAIASAMAAGFHKYTGKEGKVDMGIQSTTGMQKSIGTQRAALKKLQKELQADRFTIAVQRDTEGDVQADSSIATQGVVGAYELASLPPVIHHDETQSKTSTKAIEELIEEISLEYNLNDDQRRALVRVAGSMGEEQKEPLIMYIGGAGGTGKTRVIDAITQLFARSGQSEKLRKAAPTGVAARLIGGSTIHALMNLSQRKGSGTAKLAKMQEIWKTATHLCFDEISMCGATLLSKICAQLSVLRGNSQIFGGIHMIFSGDITQLSPVNDHPLWDKGGSANDPAVEKATKASVSEKGQMKSHGQGLWKLVNEVVLLKENHRAKNDPEFISLVERIREGHGRAKDWATLRGRVVGKAEVSDDDMVDVPLVTADKQLRDMWNDAAVKSYADRTGQEVHEYCASDRMKSEAVTGRLKEALLKLTATAIKSDAIGRIPLARGMKVMLQENVLTELGIVNGALGTLEDVVYDVEDQNRVAKVAYIRFEGSGVQMPGLAPEVVPIFPQTETLQIQTKGQRSIPIQRTQLPILPAYAFTDYKSQGQTLNFVVIDLASANRSLESAYVMVSRATSLKNVLVLRDFPFERINRLQAGGTSRELARLQRLDDQSKAQYQQDRGHGR